MNNKFLNILGLCTRAGHCIFGEEACLNGIRSGKVKLLLMSDSVSDNTRKRFTDACIFRSVKLIEFPNDSAARAAGKPGKKLIAVTDGKFTIMLMNILGNNTDTNLGVEE